MEKSPTPPDDPGATPDGRRPPADWRVGYRAAAPYLGLGMQLAFTMLFFVGLGYLADTRLGTTPWGVIGGAVLGMTALFVQLFRVVGQMNRQAERERRRRRKAP